MKVGVIGAGAIGSYLGARLAGAGCDVVLVGRKRLLDAVNANGLTAIGLEGTRAHLGPDAIQVTDDPASLSDCNVILVTVKSGQTAEAAAVVAEFASEECMVASFQNGLRNAETLRSIAPSIPVVAGMVPFNVIWEAPATFRQTTSGHLSLETGPEQAKGLAQRFADADLPIELSAHIVEIQWGKLLMNLNNSINALSGLPLKAQLSDRNYRRCLAGAIAEALQLLSAAGIKPQSPLKVPIAMVPTVLRAPTPIFRLVARAMLRIDANARSSMWDDLQRGRTTEIDFLNGEIVRLAETLGVPAPVNQAIVELVHKAENSGTHRSPGMGSADLRALLRV